MDSVDSATPDPAPAKVAKAKAKAAKSTTLEAGVAKRARVKAKVNAPAKPGAAVKLVKGDPEKEAARGLDERAAAVEQAQREGWNASVKTGFDTPSEKMNAGKKPLEPVSAVQSAARVRRQRAPEAHAKALGVENAIELGLERAPPHALLFAEKMDDAAQAWNAHDAKLLRSVIGNAAWMLNAPNGQVTRDEASNAVTDDVLAWREIKNDATRQRAALAILESKSAHFQYAIELERQAPEIAAEHGARVGKGRANAPANNAETRAPKARWSNVGSQTRARSAQEAAEGFAIRHPAQGLPFAVAAVDRSQAVPDAVMKRFLKVENDYFFPDRSPAFIDRGTRLATRGENGEVIRCLVAIAKARGWGHVTVRGSEIFRRAAWLEACVAGLDVDGYTPSKVELADLAQRKGLLPSAPENSVERGGERQRTRSDPANWQRAQDANLEGLGANSSLSRDAPVSAPVGTPVSTPAAPATPLGPLPSGAVIGKLLEHGPAQYQNDPTMEKSYFVKMQTGHGEKTVWGVDLARAVAHASVVIGETISVEKQGKWCVGSLDKAAAFAQGERAAVVQRYPELAPAYGTVAAAQKFAERHFPGHEERFVAIGKQIIAAKIARGEHVAAPDIRETKVQARKEGQDQDRSQQQQGNQERA